MATARTRLPRTAVIAGVTLGIAVAAFCNATANILSRTNPKVALSFYPGHAEALARAAMPANGRMDPQSAERAVRLGREGVRKSAVNPRAFAALGMAADFKADIPTAARQFNFADRLTRRDVVTQLWEIEYNSQRGDLTRTLVHYDSMLRSTRRMDGVLFPILAGALDDPAIGQAFKPYLRADNPWLESFITYAIRDGSKRVALAQLLSTGRGLPAKPQFAKLEGELVSYLVTERQYDAARRYFLAASRLPAGTLERVDFDASNTIARFAPLTWFVRTGQNMGAEFLLRGERNRYLEVSLAATAGTEVLSKILYLKPGTYRFAWEVSSPQPDQVGADWTVTCMGAAGGRRIAVGKVAMATTPKPQGMQFAVPAGCPVQSLALLVSSTALSDAELAVGAPALRRLR